MKLARAIAPVLVLSLSACAGPSLPFQARNDPGVAPIEKAYQALLQNYVDPPNSATLLAAAYTGARGVLTDRGIKDGTLQPPVWDKGQSANWDRFSAAYDQLAGKYGKTVGADKLEYAAIAGMAGSLKDCQTHYFAPDAMKQRQAEINGQQQFGGIGVLMKNLPGHPTILRVLKGPAEQAGLKPGDEIVAIDGKPVAGKSFEDVRNSIRGPQGQTVRITVKRPGASQPIEFDVARAQIQAPIIDAAILGNTTGYIHLYSFPAQIVSEVDQALNVFDQRGVDSVIFDVRANTGGDQQAILQVMSRFIKAGTVEMQIERNGQKTPFNVPPGSLWQHPKPLVVLADDDTQSGGEMFAKAMQEEGGYRVIGLPTAGCAASAHMYDLGDGSGIEVSTAKIVSGKGADINRVGVTPDVKVAYPVADLAAGRDTQLAAAIQALRGGAGIQPNAPVPRPSTAAPGGQLAVQPASPLIKPLTRPNGQPLPLVK